MSMSRLLTSLVAPLAALTIAGASKTHAQTNTTKFNIAAGLSAAVGDFSDRNDAGYNITVGVGMMQHGTPYGFRAEAFYNEFNQKDVSGTSHAGGATINVVYDLMPATTNQSNTLYGIGGIGYYSTREPFFTDDAQTNIGWNIGAGFRFPLTGFSAYIEARYHYINANPTMSYIPITFGLAF